MTSMVRAGVAAVAVGLVLLLSGWSAASAQDPTADCPTFPFNCPDDHHGGYGSTTTKASTTTAPSTTATTAPSTTVSSTTSTTAGLLPTSTSSSSTAPSSTSTTARPGAVPKQIADTGSESRPLTLAGIAALLTGVGLVGGAAGVKRRHSTS